MELSNNFCASDWQVCAGAGVDVSPFQREIQGESQPVGNGLCNLRHIKDLLAVHLNCRIRSSPFYTQSQLNLTFQTNDLGEGATLLLAFDMEGLDKEYYPVVWKTRTFGKRGNVVGAATHVKLKTSEQITLTKENGVFHFSASLAFTPGTGADGFLQAGNKTRSVQNPAVGFLNESNLRLKDVGDGNQVRAPSTSILCAYITSNYQKTAVLIGAIDTPTIWTQDLNSLAESTTWNLDLNKSTGQYTITLV
ncbi:hypothetical protein EDB19DRAFT_1727710 [Suillus lakei]|nr:hypothetical protein EDB19DRAFT_1727710 [Suillus lakei]